MFLMDSDNRDLYFVKLVCCFFGIYQVTLQREITRIELIGLSEGFGGKKMKEKKRKKSILLKQLHRKLC